MKSMQKVLSVVLAVVFCACALMPMANAAASDVAVGDTFQFGWYPQSRVTNEKVLAQLNSRWKGGEPIIQLSDGRAYQCVRVTGQTVPGGDQFMKIYGYEKDNMYWFQIEPIVWQVLKKDVDSVLLMAQDVLATYPYNKYIKADNTWKSSDIRAWLNDSFLKYAFSPKERSSILNTTTTNPANPLHNAEKASCEDTVDKVYLPSFEEITDHTLGFNPNLWQQRDDFDMPIGYYEKDPMRQAKSTDFAKCEGVWVDTIEPGSTGDTVNNDLDNVEYEYYPAGSGYGYSTTARYWLRTLGNKATRASAVLENGRVTTGWDVNYTIVGIRPWIRVSPDAVLDGTYTPGEAEEITPSFAITGISGDLRYGQKDVRLEADAEDVEWQSLNPDVATIDEDGNVTVKETGVVTFVATDAEGNSSALTVKVSYSWWQWLIIIFLFGWIWY